MGLTQNQLDTVVHMTIFRVQEMKKYESHIVQPSRTHHRLEIYSAGTISTNQFGTKKADFVYALRVIDEDVCDVPPMRDGRKYAHYTV